MVPPAIVFSSAIAGAAATVAVLCCLMWRTRNRTPWVGWLLLMSTAHAGFALSQVCRNSASDLVTGDLAIRGIGFFSAVLAMAWLGLARAFCGVRLHWVDVVLSLLMLGSAGYSLVSPGGTSFLEITGIISIPAGGWGPISVLQGPVDPLGMLNPALLGLVVFRIMWITIRHRVLLGRVGTALMLLSLAVVLVPLVHGYGLVAGWWTGIPLGEYAVSIIFIFFCYQVHRKEVARNVQERDRQLRLDAMLQYGQGLVGLLDPSGCLMLSNRVALAAIGATNAAVIGRPLAETPWWTHSPEAQARLRTAISRAAGGTQDRFVTTHRWADGVERDIDFSLTPFRDDSGAVLYLIAEGRDISDLRRIERQLHEGSRLEAIGQLASGIAHDFNNILGGIMGSAELANLRNADPQVRRRLETILSATSKASDLTKRLLSYARRAKTADLDIQINGVVEETVELFRRIAGPGIRIEVAVTADPSSVRSDPAEIQSAVLNLCVNARDAMPAGGVVTVATSRLIVDGPLADALGEPVTHGTYVRIDVRDSGTGIPSEIRRRVFEPFFTTKAEGQGTGLGLPAVLGTARSHHGSLLLDTQVQRGTTISLLFPAIAAAPTAVRSEPPGRHGSGLIIVVDDEPALREVATELLQLLGFTVEAFADPYQARDRLCRLDHVDCVMLDLAMPGLSGSDLYRHVRTVSSQVPVIISSGYAGGGQIPGCEDDPRMTFLPKPWRLPELRRILVRLEVLRGDPGES